MSNQKIIAVSSGKGGVGKSTVSVNLACTLSKMGFQVGILDADMYGPNIPTMMGVTEEPKLTQLESGAEIMIPPRAHGVKVMSMGFLSQPDQPMIWRGPMLHSAIGQFLNQVLWGSLDYLIVDMPPGTGDIQLSMAQLAKIDAAVLVTTPQEVALQDVRKAFRMFEKVQVPVVGLVENMSYFICNHCNFEHDLFGKNGASRLARSLGTNVLSQIPLLQNIREGGDDGYPISTQLTDLLAPELAESVGNVQVKYLKLAEQILEHLKNAPEQSPEIGNFT